MKNYCIDTFVSILLLFPWTKSLTSSFVPQLRHGRVNHNFNTNRNSRRSNVHITMKFASKLDDERSKMLAITSMNAANDDRNNDEGDKNGQKLSSVFSESVQTEAREVLEKVGWAGVAPDLSDPEKPMTSDDPFVQQIDAGIREDFGVGLDDLLNPAKVVNLERELYQLKEELQNTETDDTETIESIQSSIEKKQTKLSIERRSVFRDWLKNIFVGQAVISLGVSYVMSTNPASLFGGFNWFYSNSMDISIQVLGYWFWWLFIVPSLRSRRPRGFEKKALDIAFLGTPLVSILAPVVTKDTGLIWMANFIVVTGSYGFAYLTDDVDNDNSDNTKNQPAWLKFLYKSLDFGSGQERGARK